MPRRAYYGVVGNGETAALISPDLSLDWLCLPRFDSPPMFASALSPQRGGALTFHARPGVFPLSQRYLPGTCVLETACAGGGLLVTAQDFMPWGRRALVRDLTLANRGQAPLAVSLAWEARPLQSELYCFRDRAEGSLRLVAGSRGAACIGWAGAAPGDLTLPAGGERRYRLVLGYGESPGAARRSWEAAGGADLEAVSRWWRRWLERARLPRTRSGDQLAAYGRSLMVLKLLTYERSGAIVAAPTASLPAVPGGGDNWDYRYCWLRDGYLTALAFDAAGFPAEARAFYEYALDRQERDGSWLQPLYAVAGGMAPEVVAPDLAGPAGERPVRFGNAALSQLQLDNAGNILDGVWQHYLATRDTEYIRSRWDNVKRAAQWLARNWDQPEHGIWEFREQCYDWVYGRVMAYGGLMAASHLALELGRGRRADSWRQAAARVRRQVLARGWSPQRRAYVQHYGKDAGLDVSVLALEFYGLLPASHPRLLATARAMEAAAPPPGSGAAGGLMINGGVARYEGAALPFYLPTLWLARYCLHAGQKQRAAELLQVCLESATDLWLMAEHFDPASGAQWGNFPQGFSHQELVRLLLDAEYLEATADAAAPAGQAGAALLAPVSR